MRSIAEAHEDVQRVSSRSYGSLYEYWKIGSVANVNAILWKPILGLHCGHFIVIAGHRFLAGLNANTSFQESYFACLAHPRKDMEEKSTAAPEIRCCSVVTCDFAFSALSVVSVR